MNSRILVVEDNPINQKVTMLTLNRFRNDSDLAENGEAAVHACQAHRYGLVLMDCRMPVLNGFEATKQIRALCTPQPIIIALTANCTEAAKEQCFESGMDHYVSKPVRPDHLQSLLRQALDADLIVRAAA